MTTTMSFMDFLMRFGVTMSKAKRTDKLTEREKRIALIAFDIGHKGLCDCEVRVYPENECLFFKQVAKAAMDAKEKV